MAIVLHGFGDESINTGSSIVSFGLGRDLDAGESVAEALDGASIENLFVVDFGTGRRKPSKAEAKRIKRMARLLKTGRLHYAERKGKNGGIEYWPDRSKTFRKVA